jgi:hypothetical protein
MPRGVIHPIRGRHMAEVGSSRRCSREPEVPVSSATSRKPQHSVLVHAVAEAQKKSVPVANRSLALFTLAQERPPANAISNRELLELEHASTH